MSDGDVIAEQLEQVLEALNRIPRRFQGIEKPDDFVNSPEGEDRLDAICMILVAVGEAFKRIDRKTNGELLSRYPDVDWSGVKGVRDVIAHGYFDIDADQVFAICNEDLPGLTAAVERMVEDIRRGGVRLHS